MNWLIDPRYCWLKHSGRRHFGKDSIVDCLSDPCFGWLSDPWPATIAGQLSKCRCRAPWPHLTLGHRFGTSDDVSAGVGRLHEGNGSRPSFSLGPSVVWKLFCLLLEAFGQSFFDRWRNTCFNHFLVHAASSLPSCWLSATPCRCQSPSVVVGWCRFLLFLFCT